MYNMNYIYFLKKSTLQKKPKRFKEVTVHFLSVFSYLLQSRTVTVGLLKTLL